ncbi:MAG: SprB repeat-containing protein, partial [Bacteroidota bacterium]|nr:SprB repeat-containing protein [Bacteroidota bacterium]
MKTKTIYTRIKRSVAILLLLFPALFLNFTTKAQIVYDWPFVVDGNPIEWTSDSVVALPTYQHITDPFGNTVDNQFTQGSKDFMLAADQRWAYGQTKSKNDLCNVGAVIYNHKLHFAGDRCKISGDAMIGFWLYLNGTTPVMGPPQNLLPEHIVGDLLIIANFTNGGQFATVTVHKWVGVGNGTEGNNLSLIPVQVTEAIAAQNNSQSYPVPSYGQPGGGVYPTPTYPPNAFYEGLITLPDTLNLNPAMLCKASFLLEARSSQSLTASLDDFIAGSFHITPNPPVPTADSRCGPGIVNLTATAASGTTINWYSNPGATVLVATGTSYSPNISVSTRYWLTASTSGFPCTSDTVSVLATINPLPTLSLTETDILCNGGSDGTVTATFGGATSPYMIKIDAGAYATQTSPYTFTGLALGSHTVWVKDANNCENSSSITVNQPPVVTLSLAKTDIKCNGGNDGTVTATFGGGTSPYQIKIDAGVYATHTSPYTFTGLVQGSHTVYVQDVNLCTLSTSITVNQPPAVTLSLTKTDVLCNGGSTGTVTATFGGGTSPYMIKIDAGVYATHTSPYTFTGLAQGSHTVYVQDANLCTMSTSITVNQPPAVTLSLTETDVLCNGGSTGTV